MRGEPFIHMGDIARYDRLDSPLVYDNANGSASIKPNKTSIWLVGDFKSRRLCNIATSDFDGFNDVQVNKDVLIRMISDAGMEGQPLALYMNDIAFSQLCRDKCIGECPLQVSFLGVPMRIDRQITKTEPAVV